KEKAKGVPLGVWLGVGGGVAVAVIGLVIFLLTRSTDVPAPVRPAGQPVADNAAAKRRPQPQPVEPEEDKTPPAEDEKAKEDKPKKAKPSEDPPDEDSRPAKNAGDTGADIVEHLLKSTVWLVVPVQMEDKVMLMTGSGALIDRTNKLV